MIFKIILIVSILFLAACQNVSTKKIPTNIPTTTDVIEKKSKGNVVKERIETTESDQGFITNQKYRNIGFTLIFDDKLIFNKQINKKINNSELEIFHKKIFKNSFVKITNPENDKSIIAKVVANDAVFSDFYNSVITKRIVDELSLNPNNPYIELILFSKESTFVAKKAKTFDEEKHVADKAPVDGILINNIGSSNTKTKKVTPQKFLFSIKIADFYFKDSAENMIKRIEEETNIKTSEIKKLSNTKYRVLIGPFSDIKNLEKIFNELKPLGFENIEILKNV